MKIVVGTRGSNLALIQTNQVIGMLKANNSDVEFEIKIIKTKGDINLETPLHKMNDKGIFVKEIEKALLDKEIDLAVHSMKDMPSEHTQGLQFASVPKREDPRDILVANEKIDDLSWFNDKLIGTGSKRREYQLRDMVDRIDFIGIRGNIETRMNKINSENLDGVILAAAGLIRAGYQDRISYYFDPTIIVPSPCQGILALQIRNDDLETADIIKTIEDKTATIMASAERAYLKEIGGGCHSPVGAYSVIDGNNITLYGLYGDESGELLVRANMTSNIDNAEELGMQLAKQLKEALSSI